MPTNTERIAALEAKVEAWDRAVQRADSLWIRCIPEEPPDVFGRVDGLEQDRDAHNERLNETEAARHRDMSGGPGLPPPACPQHPAGRGQPIEVPDGYEAIVDIYRPGTLPEDVTDTSPAGAAICSYRIRPGQYRAAPDIIPGYIKTLWPDVDFDRVDLLVRLTDTLPGGVWRRAVWRQPEDDPEDTPGQG